MPCSELSSENINDVFPDCPALDDILITENGGNEVSTLAADNVAGMKSRTSALVCVEYTLEEVGETLLRLGAL